MKRMQEIERTYSINLSKPEYIKSDLGNQIRDKNLRTTTSDPFANDSKPMAQISPIMNTKQEVLKLSGQRSVAIKSGQMQVFANSGMGSQIHRLNSQAGGDVRNRIEEPEEALKVTSYNNSIERQGFRAPASNLEDKGLEQRNGFGESSLAGLGIKGQAASFQRAGKNPVIQAPPKD